MSTMESLRASIVDHAHSLFVRGLVSSTAGNISAVLDDGTFLVSPTGCCFGRLKEDELTHMKADGTVLSGPKPTKEYPLHFAFYEVQPDARAILHLHSPWATALSCLNGLDLQNVIPPVTPYLLMRLGPVPMIPYEKPGDLKLVDHIHELAVGRKALMMANHGTLVSGKDVDQAVYNAEELEETARLYMRIRHDDHRLLSADQVQELLNYA
ncbi:MAG: aldolase [Magnetovibrio sp.]|nr:aldolase [Magnetovibrio sp.]